VPGPPPFTSSVSTAATTPETRSIEQPHRVALVTGAARRIGRAIAIELAAKGWAVGVHHRSSGPEAAVVAAQIVAAGGRAVALEADLTSASSLHDLIPRCAASLGGPVSCLVNNASLFEEDALETLSPALWETHQAVNLTAPVFLSQAFAVALPAGYEGNVINIVDQRVWRPVPLFFSYSVSKAALWAATQMMAQALAPRIRVNAIGPGPVLRSIHQTKEQFDRQVGATPLERGTSPEEIARAILFILDQPAMTGQMIALDGGQHLAWRTPDVIDVEGPPPTRSAAPRSPRAKASSNGEPTP
jgi:NAD(P)-dependent dehydrogenase (short-subunit alcohol dehydrogenase family)